MMFIYRQCQLHLSLQYSEIGNLKIDIRSFIERGTRMFMNVPAMYISIKNNWVQKSWFLYLTYKWSNCKRDHRIYLFIYHLNTCYRSSMRMMTKTVILIIEPRSFHGCYTKTIVLSKRSRIKKYIKYYFNLHWPPLYMSELSLSLSLLS